MFRITSSRLLLLIILLFTLSLYRHVGTFDAFSIDDPTYIFSNPHIKDGLTWKGIQWSLTADLVHDIRSSDYWQPVTFFSRMIDIQLFGLEPGGHHLMNLLFHLANIILWYEFLFRLTGRPIRSFFVTLILAIHPMQVESVVWITERKDVLSTFFALLTLHSYLNYNQSPSLRTLVLMHLYFACGLMSKPMVFTLPILMLLLDYWFLAPSHLHRPALREIAGWLRIKSGLFILSILSFAVTVHGMKSQFREFSWDFYLAHPAFAYAWYLKQFFIPTNLLFRSFDVTWFPPQLGVISGWILIIVSLALIGFTFKRKSIIGFGLLWTGIALGPIVTMPISDRFLYYPMLGWAVTLVWYAAEVWKHFPRLKAIVTALGSSLILQFAVRSAIQIDLWKSDLNYLTYCSSFFTGNWICLDNLAGKLMTLNLLDQAEAMEYKALQANPYSNSSYLNIGVIQFKRGQYQSALKSYSKAAKFSWNFESQPYELSGLTLQSMNKHEDALVFFDLARKAESDLPNLDFERTISLLALKRDSEALISFQDALAVSTVPLNELIGVGLRLAELLSGSGRQSEAIILVRQLVYLDPLSPVVHYELGRLLYKVNSWDEAYAHFQETARLKPDHAGAYNFLGIYLVKNQHIQEALSQYDKAIELDPHQPEYLYNKGLALLRMGKISEAKPLFQRALKLDPGYDGARKALDLIASGKVPSSPPPPKQD